MEEPEIVLNLWYVVDEGTGYAYCLLGRAYALTGTDAEKLAILKMLAPTDYLMAKRFRVPENFQVILPDGRKMKGQADPAHIRSEISWVYEEVFKHLESEMPPKYKFIAGEQAFEKMHVPQAPLTVCTALIEDEDGNIIPNLRRS